MLKLLIILLSNQVGFNFVNSRLDAYLIFKNKTIAHWLNAGIFFIGVGIEMVYGWFHGFTWWFEILFLFTACLNRRVVFGISLNLRRRIKDKTITWDYISREDPPKAWVDRKEIEIFGRNGRKIHLWYIALWILFTTALFITQHYFLN